VPRSLDFEIVMALGRLKIAVRKQFHVFPYRLLSAYIQSLAKRLTMRTVGETIGGDAVIQKETIVGYACGRADAPHGFAARPEG